MTIQYDPQKVTDWLTPLEKVYARQSQQLDTYHQQLRERDRQEVAATLNVPEMFAKLASFSSSIKQVVDARETGQKKKVSSELEGLYTHPEDPDHVRKYFEYYNSKKNILKTDTEYLARLNKIKNKDLRNYLLNASAKKHIYAKEFFFSESLKALPQKWQEHREGLDAEKRAAYQRDIRPYTEKNRNYKRGWANEYLAVFKPSDGVVSGILNTGFNKWLDTSTTTDKLKANQIIHDEQELQIDRDIPTQAGLGKLNAGQYSLDWINERANLVYGKDNPDGKALAKEDYKERIVRLRRSNTLSSDQLDNILEAELVDYSGGKTGKDIFTKAQYNEIAAADQEATSAEFGLYKVTEKIKQQETLLDIEKNPENWTQAALDQEILRLENSTYADPNLLKELKEFKLSVYNKDFQATESEHFNQAEVNGTFLTKENIARAKNNKNNSIITKQKEIIQSQATNQFPNFEIRNRANDGIVMQDSKQRTLGDGEKLGAHTWKGQLSTEMTKQEDIIYMKYYNENPNDPRITAKVAADMAALKQEKGFGIPIGEDGAGEWSKDSNGNYPNFVRSKVGEIAIIDNESTWEQNFTTKWNELKSVPGLSITDNFLNTPDTILSPEEIINIVTSDDPQLSSKFNYKVGRIPNKPKGKALIQITEALINSNDPQIKELVKNSQLEKKLKELTTPNGKDLTPLQRLIQAEEFLTELVDKTSNPDTIQLHKKVEKVGFENLTPKEKIRYYNGVKLMEDLNIEKEGEEFSKTQAGIAAEALSNK